MVSGDSKQQQQIIHEYNENWKIDGENQNEESLPK